jgi:AraC-like DNA-binding protein
MLYKLIQPSPHLRPFIKEYMLLHFEFDSRKPTPVKPFPVRPQQTLVFYLKGGINAFNPETGQYKRFPKIAINGSQVRRFDFHVEHSQMMLSVDFQPSGLSKFLQMPLNDEFIDQRIDAEALLNPEISRVYEQMLNADSYGQIVEIIEAYLWRRIQRYNILFEKIDQTNLLIAQQPTAYSVEELANFSCLSISQFERRFKQQMGISPKFFARINRFYQAFTLKDQNTSLDWLSIALQTGYNDYQHLAKDFKQFAGDTPNSLLKAQAQAPERILGIG